MYTYISHIQTRIRIQSTLWAEKPVGSYSVEGRYTSYQYSCITMGRRLRVSPWSHRNPYSCYPSLMEIRHSWKNDLFSRTFPRVTDSRE